MINRIFVFVIIAATLWGQPVVKSLKYTSESSPVTILKKNDDGQVTSFRISFDVESTRYPEMDIIFRFCDKNWEPYTRLELENRMGNIDYNLEFTSLPSTVSGANYHFEGKYPSREVEFLFAGNYIFEIVNSNNRSEVYEYGKFFVVENIVEITSNQEKITLDGMARHPFNSDKAIEVKAIFTLPSNMFASQVEEVHIIKNGLIESPYIITREDYSKERRYEWDASSRMTFAARDILPGNEYRILDIRNPGKYPDIGAKATFGGYDQSRYYSLGEKDHNGGFKLMHPNDPESSYITVTFELKPGKKIDGDIFLTGAFNFWELWPIYKMEKMGDIYTLDVPLKRGVYDYEYVTGELRDGEIINVDRTAIEGNFWETINQYSIFLYYKSTELGGYDKLTGYKIITNGVRW